MSRDAAADAAADAETTAAPAAAPLYDTSWTLYRASPLHLALRHVPDQPDPPPAFLAALAAHGQRLAAHLTRDARLGRGAASLGSDNDALARAGSLQRCTWTWLSGAADEYEDTGAGAGADGYGLTTGLHIAIAFEHAHYTALFLRRTAWTPPEPNAASSMATLHLPLLLLRMPTVLRTALLAYVAAQFDARADPVVVPPAALAGALEAYLTACTPGEDDDEDADTAPKHATDVQLTLAFPDAALRSIDVSVLAADVVQLRQRGAAAKDLDGADWVAGPFTSALAAHLEASLALDPAHKAVRLARVACGGFALGREGRAKIFGPTTARGGAAGREIVEAVLDCVGAVVEA